MAEKAKTAAMALVLGEKDNVATAIVDIDPGEVPVMFNNGVKKVKVNQPIQYGHKFAVRDVGEDEDIIKYGEVIGISTKAIKTGEHVHVHNVASKRGRGDLEGKGA